MEVYAMETAELKNALTALKVAGYLESMTYSHRTPEMRELFAKALATTMALWAEECATRLPALTRYSMPAFVVKATGIEVCDISNFT
jgi:hypothetical protein